MPGFNKIDRRYIFHNGNTMLSYFCQCFYKLLKLFVIKLHLLTYLVCYHILLADRESQR
jgi:hypothetical protein